MFDGIIFDVDGTIWDSTYVVADAWNKAAEEMGLDVKVDDKTLKSVFGLPMLVIMDKLIPGLTDKEKEELLEVCSKYEMEYLLKTPGFIYEELEHVLQELSKKYTLGIVSNCQSGYIELLFETTGLGKYFTEHLCPGDTNKLKADNIKILAEHQNMKNPIYVGDTQMDANACKEAGVPFIFAKYGFGEVEKPDYSIDKPMDLLEIFK